MQIYFRQGVVTAPPNFITLNGSTAGLNINQPNQVVFTTADGQTDYIITERVSAPGAWNGPFVSGTDYWLFIDINVKTGVRTFGHTTLLPVHGLIPPNAPVNNQHWFDTTVNKMKVWNTTASRWVNRIRVFAAKLQGGTLLVSMGSNTPAFTGSQVGIALVAPRAAGALVFDANGDPIKRSNGTFFTTEDVVTTGISTASQVKFAATVNEVVALENIPAYSVVKLTDFHQVSLAVDGGISEIGIYGLVETSASTGTVVNMVTSGNVTNLSWDWTTAGVNAPLYVDTAGQLSLTQSGDSIIVARVVDKNTIVLKPTISTYSLAPITEPAIFNYTTSQPMLVSHRTAIVKITSAVSVTYTIPPSLGVPLGTTVVLSQGGTGGITIVPGLGVTVTSPETLITRKQGAKVTITKMATNVWEVEGNLVPI